jgi:hypothetical protein
LEKFLWVWVWNLYEVCIDCVALAAMDAAVQLQPLDQLLRAWLLG